MTETAILIPWRSDDGGRRDKLYAHVQKWLLNLHPQWTQQEGVSDDGPFNRGQAINNAADEAGDWEVAIIHDADNVCDAETLERAVERVKATGGTVYPYSTYLYLDRPSTNRLLDGKGWFIAPEYLGDGFTRTVRHNHVSGIQVMHRDAYEAIGGYIEMCVDEQTEIFTREGWKRHEDLAMGDQALTLNHSTGMSEWKPVQKINVHHGEREMLSIESKTHSSLTTLNHRWPVERHWAVKQVGKPHFRRMRRDWATSERFQHDDFVPVAAQCADLPTEQKYTDGLVEVVAWFWTEGNIPHLPDGSPRSSVTISQSRTANPDHCERIRSALTRAFGLPCETRLNRGRKNGVVQLPRWREHDSEIAIFSLNSEAGALLQEQAPGRIPSHDFLLSLTKAQLELFIQTSLYADGHERTCSYERNLSQKDPAGAEAFQFACVLAGYATASVTRPVMPKYGYGATVVSIRQQNRFKLSRGKHKRMTYSGVVWCPTTENGTWLARRNGKVYFTGNSGWGAEDQIVHLMLNTYSVAPEWLEGGAWHLWHAHHRNDPSDPLQEANHETLAELAALAGRPLEMRDFLEKGGHTVP